MPAPPILRELVEHFERHRESFQATGFPVCAVATKDGDKIIDRVTHRISLASQLESAKNPESKTRLQREIDATDRRIDQLVFELHGLTDEEIALLDAVDG
jgi:hypothetical protein